ILILVPIVIPATLLVELRPVMLHAGIAA
ncbi:MAG: hypothetical protein QG578_1447, partial [Thermodesulfobacteriota bacterium]|nr:hypothetical protein [Thermodesulfobacteriota bacterium]